MIKPGLLGSTYTAQPTQGGASCATKMQPLPRMPAQAELDSLIQRVGKRVRQARQRKGLSAKCLSAASGVSLRYLSLLENGKGNISISLLYKVAHVLGHRIERFLCEQDPWLVSGPIDASTLLELYNAADPQLRKRVLELLDPESYTQAKSKRICLIGLRGAGKSTLGKSLSESLGVRFVELNREIEMLCGLSIAELISLYGQEGYRKLERQALEKIIESEHDQHSVLEAAGGIVSAPDTYQYLLRHFHTIWIKATPEEHMQRVKQQGDVRPMAGNPAAMEELKSILTSREASYAIADQMVDTSGRTRLESTHDVNAMAQLLLPPDDQGVMTKE